MTKLRLYTALISCSGQPHNTSPVSTWVTKAQEVVHPGSRHFPCSLLSFPQTVWVNRLRLQTRSRRTPDRWRLHSPNRRRKNNYCLPSRPGDHRRNRTESQFRHHHRILGRQLTCNPLSSCVRITSYEQTRPETGRPCLPPTQHYQFHLNVCKSPDFCRAASYQGCRPGVNVPLPNRICFAEGRYMRSKHRVHVFCWHNLTGPLVTILEEVNLPCYTISTTGEGLHCIQGVRLSCPQS